MKLRIHLDPPTFPLCPFQTVNNRFTSKPKAFSPLYAAIAGRRDLGRDSINGGCGIFWTTRLQNLRQSFAQRVGSGTLSCSTFSRLGCIQSPTCTIHKFYILDG